jgi:hypothetical protein
MRAVRCFKNNNEMSANEEGLNGKGGRVAS